MLSAKLVASAACFKQHVQRRKGIPVKFEHQAGWTMKMKKKSELLCSCTWLFTVASIRSFNPCDCVAAQSTTGSNFNDSTAEETNPELMCGRMSFLPSTHLSFDMLQSITVFLLVFTMINGRWIAVLAAGGPCSLSFCLFRWTRFLKAICCKKRCKILRIWHIFLMLYAN